MPPESILLTRASNSGDKSKALASSDLVPVTKIIYMQAIKLNLDANEPKY